MTSGYPWQGGRGCTSIERNSRIISERQHAIPGLGIKCLRAEDIIGLKIQAYKNAPAREFHDKADILALSQTHPELDWNRIKLYADVFGEWDTLCAIRNMGTKK